MESGDNRVALDSIILRDRLEKFQYKKNCISAIDLLPEVSKCPENTTKY